MTWQTPKTDWSAEYSDTGLFIGDFFNIEDYNRIKNNLLYIRELATQLIHGVPRITVGEDKESYDEYFYADEINLIEDGLEAIDNRIPWADFGNKQTFYDNGRFIDADELNRIESAELQLYDLLTNSIEGKLRLAFRLGHRENAIRV